MAYLNFAPYLAEGAEVVLSEKTKAIISFALCGFANLSSIAILLGGLGSLAPSRRQDIARFGLKAVLAAKAKAKKAAKKKLTGAAAVAAAAKAKAKKAPKKGVGRSGKNEIPAHAQRY